MATWGGSTADNLESIEEDENVSGDGQECDDDNEDGQCQFVSLCQLVLFSVGLCHCVVFYITVSLYCSVLVYVNVFFCCIVSLYHSVSIYVTSF